MSDFGIEDVIREIRCSAEKADRLRRLNPDWSPSVMLRGDFHKPMSWRRTKRRLAAGKRLRQVFRGPDGRIRGPASHRLYTLADFERAGLIASRTPHPTLRQSEGPTSPTRGEGFQ